MAVGIAVLASNGVAGVWGAVAWLRKDPSIWFWYLLRVAQVTVVLQAVLGFVLFARGMRLDHERTCLGQGIQKPWLHRRRGPRSNDLT